VCFVQMLRLGFYYHRLALSRSFDSFPFRFPAPLQRHVSPAKNLSYWLRPHTSKSHLPVLFLHGIGIGLHTYTEFLHDLIKKDAEHPEDGQTGILAVELMPISFRLTHTSLTRDEMVAQLSRIFEKHGWEKFVLVAHSYGTIIAAYLLHSPQTRYKVSSLVLVDPVSLSIHMGDICYNFAYRKPRKASEYQLHYFACTDIGVAHTITRRFMWTENAIWKDDIKGRKVTVVLVGQDIIVDTEALGRYLSNEFPREGDESLDTPWKERAWIGDGFDFLWYDELNHAQVFDKKKDRQPLIQAVWSYCQTHNVDELLGTNGD
jgi:pimeloyl-ACP methyl ester carboxylesterase